MVDRFNFETTINSIRYFLDQAPPPPGKKYAMIIDNTSWHVKAMRLITEDPQYIDIQISIEFVRPPPYCPHLNPIEQGWRIVRYEVTHNRYFPKLDNLIKSVRNLWTNFVLQMISLKNSLVKNLLVPKEKNFMRLMKIS